MTEPVSPIPPEPPPYAAPAQSSTNGMAIAALVMGILVLFTCGLTAVLSLVFGYVARGQIRRGQGSGERLAIAGIVLGWVGVAAIPLYLAFRAIETIVWVAGR